MICAVILKRSFVEKLVKFNFPVEPQVGDTFQMAVDGFPELNGRFRVMDREINTGNVHQFVLRLFALYMEPVSQSTTPEAEKNQPGVENQEKGLVLE